MSASHDFVIVIPVADRPRQLGECLASLSRLLKRFPYAGAVSVLIVDDSLESAAIAEHRALATTHSRAGLPTHHLDRAAQRALVETLPGALRDRLAAVLGHPDAATAERLGPSICRNLASLWLSRQPRGRRLIWFVDSDERFQVETTTDTGGTRPHDIDYLHTLDRLFSARPIEVLTGKVVGDPPVSPGVMANTMLDDVLAFFSALAAEDPHAPCRFHGKSTPSQGAAYHDMADLFGYAPAPPAPYRCPLPGAHDHIATLDHFAAGLKQFFDGVHPTRRSLFEVDEPLRLAPARTVYTGNYVITDAALAWFIPFADLKLRMAGPTLGRLLKAELKDRFVCASLPLWHGRTLAGLGRSECRPGVVHTADGVDLRGEFERQYYGDVLLFSIEALTDLGYPHTNPGADVIRRTVAAVEARLHARYLSHQSAVEGRIDRLSTMLSENAYWWNTGVAAAPARQALARFLHDLKHNFGLKAAPWRAISATDTRATRRDQLCRAIMRYPAERTAWQEALNRS
ncbi:MAG: hypothetical protein ACUVT2_01285 [Thiobacillaceae bacterium]